MLISISRLVVGVGASSAASASENNTSVPVQQKLLSSYSIDSPMGLIGVRSGSRTTETEFIVLYTLSGGTTICSKRSEEHTSELQSLMRISYAVFCLKKKT